MSDLEKQAKTGTDIWAKLQNPKSDKIPLFKQEKYEWANKFWVPLEAAKAKETALRFEISELIRMKQIYEQRLEAILKFVKTFPQIPIWEVVSVSRLTWVKKLRDWIVEFDKLQKILDEGKQ